MENYNFLKQLNQFLWSVYFNLSECVFGSLTACFPWFTEPELMQLVFHQNGLIAVFHLFCFCLNKQMPVRANKTNNDTTEMVFSFCFNIVFYFIFLSLLVLDWQALRVCLWSFAWTRCCVPGVGVQAGSTGQRPTARRKNSANCCRQTPAVSTQNTSFLARMDAWCLF